MGSTTDVSELQRGLATALRLQYRSSLSFAVAAGALTGPLVALHGTLREFAAAELRDVEAVAGRLTLIGGQPPTDAPALAVGDGSEAILRCLVEQEREAIGTLVDAIPADADDSEGEATEHLLEHVIHRKRQQLELLQRAVGESQGALRDSGKE